jgi:uncharacterized protein YbgA (DUF1722 family)
MVEKTRPFDTKFTLSHDNIKNFVLKQFDDAKQEGNINNLIKFHSINKYLIMAQSPIRLNDLGNIIAKQDKIPLSSVFERYEMILKEILEKEPTRKTHSNVLMKILGYFKVELSNEDKVEISKMIFDYKNGLIEIDVLLSRFDELTRRFGKTYLVRQTYFLAYAKVDSAY